MRCRHCSTGRRSYRASVLAPWASGAAVRVLNPDRLLSAPWVNGGVDRVVLPVCSDVAPAAALFVRPPPLGLVRVPPYEDQLGTPPMWYPST